MLNRVVLMGRITQDLELKTLSSGVSTLSFTIAVERSYAPQGSERQTDFINCVAWRQKAEFISKYFGKGAMIAIEGSIQTRKYQDKTGPLKSLRGYFRRNRGRRRNRRFHLRRSAVLK